MTKTNNLKSYTRAGIHHLLCQREEAVQEAIAAVNQVRSEIARRANEADRAKQAKAGTKRLQVSSLRKGMELKVPGGFSKIIRIGTSQNFFQYRSHKHITLANGKGRNLSLTEHVMVKA